MLYQSMFDGIFCKKQGCRGKLKEYKHGDNPERRNGK